MKKLLLILIIGISFSPAAFAVGPANPNQMDAPGAILCPLAAGYHAKKLANDDSGKSETVQGSDQSGSAY